MTTFIRHLHYISQYVTNGNISIQDVFAKSHCIGSLCLQLPANTNAIPFGHTLLLTQLQKCKIIKKTSTVRFMKYITYKAFLLFPAIKALIS